ncbi:MAG TPA: RNA-binding S4 domain-containing protein [Gammaproteobacteria bacterium]|nr:RNA-binding S4 domain-containing protein [Gammaproteobacteria bacterium]
MADSVRIDKWLWATRFYKTRSLAAESVSGGKVHLNGMRVKPAKGVKVGDRLEIRRGHEVFEVDVLGLMDRRGPARVAQTQYEETEASRRRREEEAALRKLSRAAAPAQRRPPGRDRARIRRFNRDQG